MKTININGKEYKVIFRHYIPKAEDYKQGDLSNNKFKKHFRALHGTTCLIVDADVSNEAMDIDYLAVGVTHLSPNDNYNRRKGRELSLDKALQRSPFTYSQGMAILRFCFPEGLKFLFTGEEK